MAHFAGLVAAGLHPRPGAACAHHLVHGAQDDRRPALGLHPHGRRRPGQEDQLERLPRSAGRPAHARHRRQGRGIQAGGRAGVRGAPAADHLRREDPRRQADRRRRQRRPASTCSPAAPTCTSPWSICASRRSTASRRRSAARGGDHREPQRGAVRSAAADGDIRRSDRHAGPSRPAASATPTSPRWRTSSPRRCIRRSRMCRPYVSGARAGRAVPPLRRARVARHLAMTATSSRKYGFRIHERRFFMSFAYFQGEGR